MSRHYDVDDEDIGLRTFHLRKRRAVERAVEKIRHRMGKDWGRLDQDEMEALEWALGETWAMMGFREWDDIGFSFMELKTARQIVDVARQVLKGEKLGTRAFEEIHVILKAMGPAEGEELTV